MSALYYGQDILPVIEKQLKSEDFEMPDLLLMLATAAKEIRELRGMPANPELEGY